MNLWLIHLPSNFIFSLQLKCIRIIYIFMMHSSIEGHFRFLSIVTKAVMNITEGQSVNRMSSLVLGFLLLYWNTMGKRNWRGKGLFCVHLYITLHDQRKSGQQVKQGRGWQELMKRLWRCAAYWFAHHGLVNLFLRGSKPGMYRDWLVHLPWITN